MVEEGSTSFASPLSTGSAVKSGSAVSTGSHGLCEPAPPVASPELLLPRWEGERAPRSRRRRLEAELRESIRSGRLRPGARLPSSRALAGELGVSRRLVVEVYDQLGAEGYVIARRGSGTCVAPRASGLRDGAVTIQPRELPPAVKGIDLFPGAPDLSLFPRRAWGRVLRRALAELPDARLAYGELGGTTELRVALAEHLGRVRAAEADAGRVVVTAGFQQGLRIFCQLVRERGGRRIAIEDPGYMVAAWAIESQGLEVVPVEIDDEGIDVDALAAAAPDAVVVTPAHSLPLGAVLAPDRRRRLVAWAREHGALVLEDDYDAELRYDRGPAGALQGLGPDVVVLAGTTSKTLAPALRIGWLLLPRDLVPSAITARAAIDAGGPRIDEWALAELISSGAFDRHVRAARQRYRAKRGVLLDAIAAELPRARVRGIAAGLHVVLELPDGATEDGVCERARRAGTNVYGLAIFTRAHARPPALVLGYGLPPERQLREAVATIAAAVVEELGEASADVAAPLPGSAVRGHRQRRARPASMHAEARLSRVAVESLAAYDILRLRADNPGPFTLSGTNSWIVGRDPAWVVDPGPELEPHIDALAAELRRRGGCGGIAITHSHPDHLDGAAALAARVGEPPIAGAERPVRLADGDRFGPFEAVATPGHAPDHLAFVRGAVAFTGDAVLGEGSVFVPPDGGGLGPYLDGLRRLRERGLDWLCPGHGPPIDRPAAKLDEYIAHRLDRERRLVEALRDGARGEDELLDRVWDDAPVELRAAAALTLRTHLDKLAAEGRLPPAMRR